MQNHVQEESFSESTTQKTSGNIWLLVLELKADKRVPTYLFFMLVPLIDMTGRQCCQSEIEPDNAMKKYQNLPSTSTWYSTVEPMNILNMNINGTNL